MNAAVIRADARDLPLPDASVDLIVTSPPYFGLRSYTDGGEHYPGQIGSEGTPGPVRHGLTCNNGRVRRYEADTVVIAAMVGVAPHVIRNWAARGHIKPVRADGNRTIYDAEEVAKVATRLGHLPELTEQSEACCWPDCDAAAWDELLAPLCLKHTMAIWTGVNEVINARMAPLEDIQPPPVNPVVYFIQVGDRIKIGTTSGLRGRLESLRTHANQEPKVLLAVPGGYTEERQVHALFAAERVRGEWFEPSERLLQFIADRRDQDVRHVEGVHYLPD